MASLIASSMLECTLGSPMGAPDESVTSEPHRDLRRLFSLRGLSHEKEVEQVLTRGARARGTLAQEHHGEHLSLGAVNESIAPKIGCVPQILTKVSLKPAAAEELVGKFDPPYCDLAPAHALQAQAAHEPLDPAARHRDALEIHLLPDLGGTVDLPIGVQHALDLWRQCAVALGAPTSQGRDALLGGVAPIA